MSILIWLWILHLKGNKSFESQFEGLPMDKIFEFAKPLWRISDIYLKLKIRLSLQTDNSFAI